MITTQQDFPLGLFSTDRLPPFYGHVYGRSMLTPPALYGTVKSGLASFGDPSSWSSDHKPKLKPPPGSNAAQRIQQLIDTYGGADLSSYGGGPPSQQLIDIGTELQYWVNGDSWVYCTLINYLNGTPSEDSLGWWSGKFTAHCMEDECGDRSYGDQYAEALKILAAQGAPPQFVAWIKAKSDPLLAKKTSIYRKDASETESAAWRAAARSINPFDPSSPISPFNTKSPMFYVTLGLAGLLLFNALRK